MFQLRVGFRLLGRLRCDSTTLLDLDILTKLKVLQLCLCWISRPLVVPAAVHFEVLQPGRLIKFYAATVF